MQNNQIEKDKTYQDNNVQTTQVNSGEMGVKSYGKFKDTESLLNAYNSLQSEFTRRCQRVKELERELSVVKTNPSVLKPTREPNADNSVKPLDESAEPNKKELERKGELFDGDNLTEEVKRKIIREYLNGIKSSKPEIPLISGNGTAIVAPPLKNFNEAGQLALQILKNKEIY